RVRILGRIRMAMVLAVVSGPPERPLLHGAASQTRQDKLKPAAGLVRAMGKVAVISGRDAEHAYKVKAGAEHDRQRRGRNEENRQAGQMHEKKRQVPYPRGQAPRLK